MDLPLCQEAVDRFSAEKPFRVLLFGASNTERYAPFMHWCDVLETSLRKKYFRKFHLINSGFSGSNTREARARFDWLVRDFAPDVVIITFGGNDSINRPERFIAEDEYRSNLEFFVDEIRQFGGIPVLQTYYKPDLDGIDPVYAGTFVRYMEVIREIARDKAVFLVDQYKFFEQLDKNTHLYKLLLNAMHLNETGNLFMGVILARHFGLEPENVPHNEKLLSALKYFNDSVGE